MGLTGDEGDIDDYMYDMDIARHVEQEKLQQILHASIDLKSKLATRHGRCKICTLKPPCRHTKDTDFTADRLERSSKMSNEKSKLTTK